MITLNEKQLELLSKAIANAKSHSGFGEDITRVKVKIQRLPYDHLLNTGIAVNILIGTEVDSHEEYGIIGIDSYNILTI